MPGGTVVGRAAGGHPRDTGLCHDAECHTVAHIGSHLDTSDGVKR